MVLVMAKRERSVFKAVVVVFAALLAFIGPTYAVYALYKLGIRHPIPDAVGVLSLILGITLILYTEKRSQPQG
ncbi:hypothetical protein DRO48_02890 [Candidatus Bathyarchaeota archaeon]|nr:MAG: hypothetical protein DRO48_02890 [Candidatus Bathyarchaeota archaeon]